jgi:hypothetical protein
MFHPNARRTDMENRTNPIRVSSPDDMSHCMAKSVHH